MIDIDIDSILREDDATKYTEEEIELVADEILKKKDSLQFIVDTVQKIHKGDSEGIALAYLCGLTPFMNTDQLHLIAMGLSGKGKSDLLSKVLVGAFPTNTYRMITSTTPKALHYGKKAGRLMDKGIIFIDEATASEEAIPILRAITSSGLVKPEHWTVDEKRKFSDLKLDGSYSLWLSSVNPIADDQLKNRFMFLNVDESSALDELVFKHQDSTYRVGNEKKPLPLCFAVAKKVTQIITESKVTTIKIPYEIQWNAKHNRRLYPFFLTLIKACTFCHQYQREMDTDGKWIATRYDFELINYMWSTILEFMQKRVNKEATELLSHIPNDRVNASTRVELAEKSGLAVRQVKYLTDILTREGLVNWDTVDTKGKPNVYWKSQKFVGDCLSVAEVDWDKIAKNPSILADSVILLRQKTKETIKPERVKTIVGNILDFSVLPTFCRRGENIAVSEPPKIEVKSQSKGDDSQRQSDKQGQKTTGVEETLEKEHPEYKDFVEKHRKKMKNSDIRTETEEQKKNWEGI
jgi:hypothetical protein